MSKPPSLLMFGVTGQIARRLRETLAAQYDMTALDRAACDFAVADQRKLETIMRAVEPSLIVNATGYTAVDRAESEPDLAKRINGTVPGLIAIAAQIHEIPFLHFSTDYVFDGVRGMCYTEEDRPNPLNVYGESKQQGEETVLAAGGHVFRLQWVYDTSGQNFFTTMQRLLRERTELRVVADQIGAPTSAQDVAHATAQALPLIRNGGLPAGLYHLTAQGQTSWHGFTCAMAEMLGANASVLPIASAEYPLPATRPKDTRLDCSKLAAYGIQLPHWRQALTALFNEKGSQ